MVACANRHAFLHMPQWLQEQKGCTYPNPLGKTTERVSKNPNRDLFPSSCTCAICGIECATPIELKKHVGLSHKRVWREMGFNIHDSGGYGLQTELVRAGFWVRMVDRSPQAADRALKRQMKHSMNNNVQCICLVSDDSDFANILKTARSKEVCIVIVGDSDSLHQYADIWLSWTEVAQGKDVMSTCTWQGIGNSNLL
ncbi:hypothetical protein L7F22_025010 [Adiantum nelumboides]|nr:hypothetical protein [Adiantum nelumboides]